ncbi:MAG: NBR1-Ig-like domain-containing protein [Chloroflexota bacterium]
MSNPALNEFENRVKIEQPYIGPRSFEESQAHLFFGRSRETDDLTSLIISDRVVLCYAQSGAGKSSLINTRILPGLRAEGFEVLPVARVGGSSGFEIETGNIFLYNLISGLHQNRAADQPLPTDLALSSFLDNLVYENDAFQYNPKYVYREDEELKPRVLIIDQFEEVFTTNTSFWKQREGFFEQLGAVLQEDDYLWVLLSIREDFIAGLDPYIHLFPNQLRSRYYLQKLDPRAALEAVSKPALLAGKPFTAEAANLLVDNLRVIHSKSGEKAARRGQFVESVQLQAVCSQLWQRVRYNNQPEITVEDVRNFGDVDSALRDYYEDVIARVIKSSEVFEYHLRHWFENDLITDAGTRSLVYRGKRETGSLSTGLVDILKESYILREVVRPGGIWYELPHDRFVSVIIDANHEWRLNQPYLKLAEDWDRANRPEAMLVDGSQLDRLLESEWEPMGPLVADLVEASLALRDKRKKEKADRDAVRAEQQAQARARLYRRFLAVALVFLAAAVVSSLTAFRSAQRARESEIAALSAQDDALQQANIASTAQTDAIEQAQTASAAEDDAIEQAQTASAAQNEALKQAGAAQSEATRVEELLLYAESQLSEAQSTIIAYEVEEQDETGAAPPAVTPTLLSAGFNEEANRLSLEATLAALEQQEFEPEIQAIFYELWVPVLSEADPGSPLLTEEDGEPVFVEGPTIKEVLKIENDLVYVDVRREVAGWINPIFLAFAADRTLLPESLPKRVMIDRYDLPFVEGVVVGDGNSDSVPVRSSFTSAQTNGNVLPFLHNVNVLDVVPDQTAQDDAVMLLVTYIVPERDDMIGIGFVPYQSVVDIDEEEGFVSGAHEDSACGQYAIEIKDDRPVVGNGQLTPGSYQFKTWMIRNAGDCPIEKDTLFYSANGEISAATKMAIPEIRPGMQASISLVFQAPQTAGNYQSTWHFVAPDGTLFGSLPLDITVQ